MDFHKYRSHFRRGGRPASLRFAPLATRWVIFSIRFKKKTRESTALPSTTQVEQFNFSLMLLLLLGEGFCVTCGDLYFNESASFCVALHVCRMLMDLLVFYRKTHNTMRHDAIVYLSWNRSLKRVSVTTSACTKLCVCDVTNLMGRHQSMRLLISCRRALMAIECDNIIC